VRANAIVRRKSSFGHIVSQVSYEKVNYIFVDERKRKAHSKEVLPGLFVIHVEVESSIPLAEYEVWWSV